MGIDDFTKGGSDASTALANISQDHWERCSSGPSNPEVHGGHTGPWTAVSETGPDPTHLLEEGDIILARQTNRTSKGKVVNGESGVYGIWKYSHSAPVNSQQTHPWNHEYRWYIYCEDVETHQTPIYHEDWDDLNIVPQKLTGEAIYALSTEEEQRYLNEILDESNIKNTTRRTLNKVLEE